MPMEQILLVVLSGLLGCAVVTDVRRHRIPNLLILFGLALALGLRLFTGGSSSVGEGLQGLLIGFAIFLPLYAFGGMAAGDVKLMAMTGAFLTPGGTLWAAALSLMVGGLWGAIWVLSRGQVLRTFGRYWLMVKARCYLAPEADEIAGKPLPYAIAILLGTLISIFWQPFGQ
ncbi:prepilin peptidase [Pseudomonas sp. LFM046]|uniref:A24 family peptidase n=1 Tax=Pseudomonas sp. LFM046 TaxID=1608357 RepID=UPI0005CFD987|nr:prepilin peptidase [Pseudomonas sp. LFM046]